MSNRTRGKACTFEVSGDCPMCIKEEQGEKAVNRFLGKYKAFAVCPKHFMMIEQGKPIDCQIRK